MKIYLLANNIPLPRHSTGGAVTMVLYQSIDYFLTSGHEIVLQLINQVEDRRPLRAGEEAALAHLRERGVAVEPPLFRSDYQPPAAGGAWTRVSKAATMARAQVAPAGAHYPALRLRRVVHRRIGAAEPDVVLPFWCSEGLAATFALRDVPKVAYYGVPDHLPALGRMSAPALFGGPAGGPKLMLLEAWLRSMERAHLRLMLDCDVAANICAEHAAYYARNGHERSTYVPNMWPVAPGEQAPSQEHGEKPRILGSLGSLSATGNTFGLLFLAREILPRLDRVWGPDGYEVHIFGNGEPVPAVGAALEAPSVRRRGFVDDIDAEIRRCHVFLVANNTGAYRGSHTRFLHAWSLGACTVGHRYNEVANPEMVHGENVLLAEHPDAFVEQIVRAVSDAKLRERVGHGGWRTFREHFRPHKVCRRLVSEMEAVAAR